MGVLIVALGLPIFIIVGLIVAVIVLSVKLSASKKQVKKLEAQVSIITRMENSPEVKEETVMSQGHAAVQTLGQHEVSQGCQMPSQQEEPPVYQAPTYQESEPVYQAPMYQESEPVYQAPTYQESELVYQKPMYQESEPVYQAPMYQESEPVYQAPTYQESEPVYQSNTYEEVLPTTHSSSGGNAALVIGVLFIVLAGFIFGTTQWSLLSDGVKFAMILGVTVVFFLASFIAEKAMRIQKTSNAFYITASVFLMITVICGGFFELFGDTFSIYGDGFLLLFGIGIGVMEASLVLGRKRFGLGGYSYVIVVGGASTVLLFVCGLVRFFVGGELASSDVFLYGAIGTLIVYSMLDAFQVMDGIYGKSNHIINGCSAGALFFAILLHVSFAFDITMSAVVATWLLTGDLLFLSIRKNQLVVGGITNLSLLAALYVTVGYLDVEWRYATLIAGFLVLLVYGILLFCKGNLHSLFTDVVYIGNIWILCVLSFFVSNVDDSFHWENFGIVVILIVGTILIMLRDRKSTMKINGCLPFLLVFGVAPIKSLIDGGLSIKISGLWLLFGFLCCYFIIDFLRRKPELIQLSILAIFMELMTLGYEHNRIPFLFLFGIYLLGWYARKKTNALFYCGASALIVGGYILTMTKIEWNIWGLFAVAAVVGMYWLISKKNAKLEDRSMYLAIVYNVLVSAMVLAFYKESVPPWAAIGIFAFFVIAYLGSYETKGCQAHGLGSIFMIVLPVLLSWKCDLSDTVSYGILLGAALVINGVSKLKYQIVVKKDNHWYIDWLNLFLGFYFLIGILCGNSIWRFVFVIASAVYVLQFYVVAGGRNQQVVKTILLGVLCTAVWVQPFGILSGEWNLVVDLLPVILSSFLIKKIWGEEHGKYVARSLDCICFGIMILYAIVANSLFIALLVEGCALFLFLFSGMKKNAFYQRVSGGILLGVTVYMTRSFWLSISWWVYLLVAGIVLIALAARKEWKKRE